MYAGVGQGTARGLDNRGPTWIRDAVSRHRLERLNRSTGLTPQKRTSYNFKATLSRTGRMWCGTASYPFAIVQPPHIAQLDDQEGATFTIRSFLGSHLIPPTFYSLVNAVVLQSTSSYLPLGGRMHDERASLW